MSWLVIFGASLAVYLVITVGAATRWAGWLTEDADQSLLRLTVRVLFPCLIFSIVSNNASLRSASNVILPPLVGYGTMAIGFLAAAAVTLLGPRATGLADQRERRTFAACIGIYNYGFIPVPLVEALFGSKTLGVLFVHNVGSEMAVWTLGVMFMSGALGRGWWKQMFNACSATIVLALAVNFLGLYHYIPKFVSNAVAWLGAAGVPLSMVLIGAIVADELQARGRRRRAADSGKILAWAALLRLGLLPAAFLALAWLLPASDELKRVIVVQAAMPSGTFPIVMARHYGGDPGVALRVALGTSLASLLTIPLWISTGLALLGL